MDTVAELFCRNESGKYTALVKVFSPQLDHIQSDAEWLILLRGLVINRTKQALTRIFKERDPETARLIRSVRIAVVKGLGMQFTKDSGLERIRFYSGSRNHQPSKQITIDFDPIHFLHKELFQSFSPNDTVPEMLIKIKHAFQKQHELPCSIPVIEVIRVLKTYRRRFAPGTNTENPMSIHGADDRFAEEEIRFQTKRVLKMLTFKLQRYVQKQKLDIQTAHCLRMALESMLEDMIAEGSLSSHLVYIQHFIPTMNPEQYREKYRMVFEYFVRMTKREMVKIIFNSAEGGTGSFRRRTG